MDMSQFVERELSSCNALQIQDGELFCSLKWNAGGFWELVAGEMPKDITTKGFTSMGLLNYMIKMPHESRRKGTVLLITGIPLDKKV